MKYGISADNKTAKALEREISESLCCIQNSFHSAVSAFTALERKGDDIVGKITEERKKQNFMTTLWESLFFLKDHYCELNKDIA